MSVDNVRGQLPGLRESVRKSCMFVGFRVGCMEVCCIDIHQSKVWGAYRNAAKAFTREPVTFDDF